MTFGLFYSSLLVIFNRLSFSTEFNLYVKLVCYNVAEKFEEVK